jgi:hypothetical protein
MFQIGIKYTHHFPFQGPTKFTQIWIFGLKTNHLAALLSGKKVVDGPHKVVKRNSQSWNDFTRGKNERVQFLIYATFRSSFRNHNLHCRRVL